MLEKTYQPAEIEPRIRAEWEEAQAFRAGRADRRDAEPYCIVIPPPNVTGSLHMGHALNNTLQDVLCRFERMRGKDVLWQPGTDHAGIATQMVVERQLMERQEPNRRALGRDKFVEKVWAWKEESGSAILNQLKRLGASCDWSRERFTMDEGLSKAVLKVFVDLYNSKLIYKDKRLVNWDPKFQTAISDLEVVQVEAKGSFSWTAGDPEKPFDAKALAKVLDRNPSGHMYHVRYPLAAKVPGYAKDYIVVATTRPETMLGDTGVAVHPDDERYAALVKANAKVKLPLVGREIPIVADEYSDPEKGSGAVKITPAHDKNDFEVAKRYNARHSPTLQAITIFDTSADLSLSDPFDVDGFAVGLSSALTDPTFLNSLNRRDPASMREAVIEKLNSAGQRETAETIRELDGLHRDRARLRVVELLAERGLLDKIEPTTQMLPFGDRSNLVVEDRLTEQWYVNAAELAKPAIRAVESGKTTFVPKNWEKTYFEWMRNIQPWCISRQLWWGHQIPAWYGFVLDKNLMSMSKKKIFVFASEKQAIASAAEYCLRNERPPNVVVVESENDALNQTSADKYCIWQDPDVLDTWFSSALWPFSTLGWPDQTLELSRYYPTTVLVTGFDIIFFWVARMMMMGLHFMKEVPFHDVYIHALVRDEKGQKMSKSKGNVMDPLVLVDTYGADALRFTLAAMAAQGRDIKLSANRVEGYRNFATKLWNASRFAEMNECVRKRGFDPATVKETINRWIVGETERAAHAVTESIEAYKFNEAAAAIYEFVWGIFCDWYLELIKPTLTGDNDAAKKEARATVAWTLDQILKLLHPFMPFITEELWAHMVEHGERRENLLALSQWPRLLGLTDAAVEEEIGWVVRLVNEIRSVRTEMNVPAAAKIQLALPGASAAVKERARKHQETISRLARLEGITFPKTAPKGAAMIVIGDTSAALPLAGVIDTGAEMKRLGREIEKAQGDLDKMDAKLTNPQFMAKAKEEAVEEARERKAELEEALKRLRAAVKRIEAAA